MKPHLEEALRMLRLADRDIAAFSVLRDSDEVHISVVCFHAQQAVEKSLKALLFVHQIEFRRTHDLLELANLLEQHGIPLSIDKLIRVNLNC
jgi:HEPN domain-containing protein